MFGEFYTLVACLNSARILQFFACGSGVVAKGIKSKLIELLHSVFPEEDDAEVLAKFERITKGRYVTDVFD